MNNVHLITGESLMHAAKNLHWLPDQSHWIMCNLIETEVAVCDLIDIFEANKSIPSQIT